MSRIAGSPTTNPGCIFFLTSEKNPANGFHAKQKVGLFFRIAIKGNIDTYLSTLIRGYAGKARVLLMKSEGTTFQLPDRMH